MHNNESIAHLERYRKKQKIKNRNYLHQDCPYSAINSHLLQKNGILNNIAKNGHVIQLSTQSLFSIFSRKNQISEHKEIGLIKLYL